MVAAGDGQAWRKSSHSASGDCLEWQHVGDIVRVRHSREPQGPVISFTQSEWQAFISGVKGGEADIIP
jgi:hypothetical protein